MSNRRAYENQIITVGGDLIAKINGNRVFQRDFLTGVPNLRIEVTVNDLCRRILVMNDLRQLAGATE